MLRSAQRTALLAASRSGALRTLAENTALLRPVVDRFVAGTTVDEVVAVARDLTSDRCVTVDHLGEDTTDRARAEANVDAYRTLLRRLGEDGLAPRVEVSVKLSALGQALPGADAEKIALDHAQQVCEAAHAVGTTVTVDMEDHTTTDSTLGIVRDLRVDHPWVGAVVQAGLRRTEGDCRDLAGPGSRVRLCKGAYDEPASVAFRDRHEVDRSYVRCLQVLMAGEGLPMVATHDPVLIDIARHLGRDRPHEIQMLHGVRPREQQALATAGETVRVYLPYGTEWYGYFVRRLAERPANLAFFARSLLTRG
ncbi:proline dehydrogenase family protein [Pseudonocardia sp. KRD-184]|uniref:Proline dehydrogenase family protein n=1 Tax=Pseudonocardia oceani TaxID=2792013 RepID=A0ABS6UDM9_9PSEU|nr:proline dehydrogenase family protein [Pseudonocardia oceani]MBW0089384.1 proline dehydrogenase family protein [Pseudonocardia oceani]MBW0098794.1 proline dehydrogenase family protein [Pseudonocardia oceani]MBW0107745.1 proline dehydrogenase family protein [Pseudonocardia oceani]MBW0123288.1 proline dehydrogenase family protein [Pseudonocardia oceani]MBW0130322.1 proline dehydrogenase family protein [Pseudonocardia oceani]